MKFRSLSSSRFSSPPFPTLSLPLSFFFSLFFFSLLNGKRPELVSSSLWVNNLTVTNIPVEVGVLRLKFDQPMYATGGTFLCSSAAKECPQPIPCTPCDWSGQNV